MVALVLVSLFQYINNIATDLGFEKRFTSMDLGLLTTVVYYVPGTIKHTYIVPIDFPIPMDFIFERSLVDVMEHGRDLHMYYWFMSDRNLDQLEEDLTIYPSGAGEGQAATGGSTEYMGGLVEEQRKVGTLMPGWGGALAPPPPEPNFTYFRSGRQISFDIDTPNPLQLICPVVNTTIENWRSQKVFVMKVLPDPQDYSNESLPTNRIAQIISARYSNFEASGSGTSSSTGAGSRISAIPDDAKIVLVVGHSAEDREPGALIVYIPADDKVMEERKFACFMINDLLTSDTLVYYTQVMPVFTGGVDDDSPLRVFDERSSPDQVMVFLDVSRFGDDQINVDKVVDAIYRAVERYYGGHEVGPVVGATFSFTAPPPGMLSPTARATELGEGAGRPGAQRPQQFTPAEIPDASGDSAPRRMFSVCERSKQSLAEGMRNLLAITPVWAQESTNDGAVYVKGGFTAQGNLQCTNHGLPSWIIEQLTKFFPGEAIAWPAGCDPSAGDKQSRECKQALRQLFQERVALPHYSGRYLCGDCMTYLVQLYRCAFGQVELHKTHPTTAPVIAGTPGAISGYNEDGDVIYNKQVWGVNQGDNCWDDVIMPQLGGRLQFGDLIEMIPKHFVMYTGGAGLDYELIEMGGFSFPSSSGITTGYRALTINLGGEKPRSVRVIQHADIALRNVKKGCLIRRASEQPSTFIPR
ncbi:hypothetical protein KY359_00390 [Candidatus Woesearchaeota archaeon]|nr:hypothetical protein [Candidatus Woesearchaeota archaeon]